MTTAPFAALSDDPSLGKPLTARQRRILTMIARGLTNRQIALELHVGEDTVKTLVRRVFLKLGVSNRPAAVHQGWLLNLLGSDTLPAKARVPVGDDLLATIANLIEAHGGDREWVAFRELCADRDTARRNQQLLAKLRGPAPELHAVPTAQAGA